MVMGQIPAAEIRAYLRGGNLPLPRLRACERVHNIRGPNTTLSWTSPVFEVSEWRRAAEPYSVQSAVERGSCSTALDGMIWTRG
jgi:hypothetical protein